MIENEIEVIGAMKEGSKRQGSTGGLRGLWRPGLIHLAALTAKGWDVLLSRKSGYRIAKTSDREADPRYRPLLWDYEWIRSLHRSLLHLHTNTPHYIAVPSSALPLPQLCFSHTIVSGRQTDVIVFPMEYRGHSGKGRVYNTPLNCELSVHGMWYMLYTTRHYHTLHHLTSEKSYRETAPTVGASSVKLEVKCPAEWTGQDSRARGGRGQIDVQVICEVTTTTVVSAATKAVICCAARAGPGPTSGSERPAAVRPAL
ncbi:hypothetical protein J6590_009873 [Homalodisca vitripennis]|nr:hypothetical protein J6590_009873 [Homalodisca vitripennis]